MGQVAVLAMRPGWRLAASVLAFMLAGSASAHPTNPAEPASQPAGAQVLESTANTVIQRLPTTCEATIHTRVSEWKAGAAIACKKSAGAKAEACVNAQLKSRAEQLGRVRSCRFL